MLRHLEGWWCSPAAAQPTSRAPCITSQSSVQVTSRYSAVWERSRAGALYPVRLEHATEPEPLQPGQPPDRQPFARKDARRGIGARVERTAAPCAGLGRETVLGRTQQWRHAWSHQLAQQVQAPAEMVPLQQCSAAGRHEQLAVLWRFAGSNWDASAERRLLQQGRAPELQEPDAASMQTDASSLEATSTALPRSLSCALLTAVPRMTLTDLLQTLQALAAFAVSSTYTSLGPAGGACRHDSSQAASLWSSCPCDVQLSEALLEAVERHLGDATAQQLSTALVCLAAVGVRPAQQDWLDMLMHTWRGKWGHGFVHLDPLLDVAVSLAALSLQPDAGTCKWLLASIQQVLEQPHMDTDRPIKSEGLTDTSSHAPSLHQLTLLGSALFLGIGSSPSRAWLLSWSRAAVTALPAAAPTEAVQLLQLLAALPRHVASEGLCRDAAHQPLFAAIWDCTRAELLHPEQQLAALAAAGSLQKRHGMAPPEAWVCDIVAAVLSSFPQLAATPANPSSTGSNGPSAASTLVGLVVACNRLHTRFSKEQALKLGSALGTDMPHMSRPELMQVAGSVTGLLRDLGPVAASKLQACLAGRVLQLLAPHRQEPASAGSGATQAADWSQLLQLAQAQRVLGARGAAVHQPPPVPIAAPTPGLQRPINLAQMSAQKFAPFLPPAPLQPHATEPNPSNLSSSHADGPLPPAPSELANWLHALTTGPGAASCMPPQLLANLQQALLQAVGLPLLRKAGDQDLVTILSGLTRLGCRPKRDWASAVVAETGRRLRTLSPQHLAVLLWAVAQLQMGPYLPPWWVAAAHNQSAAVMAQLSPRYLSQVTWAVARIAQQQQQAAPSRQGPAAQPASDAAGLTSTATDAATPDASSEQRLGQPQLPSARWLLQLLRTSGVAFRVSDPQSLSNLAWAAATLVQPPLAAATAAGFGMQHDDVSVVPEQYMAVTSDFDPQELVAWQQLMGDELPCWLAAMRSALHGRMHSASAHSLSNGAWSVAELELLLHTWQHTRHAAGCLNAVSRAAPGHVHSSQSSHPFQHPSQTVAPSSGSMASLDWALQLGEQVQSLAHSGKAGTQDFANALVAVERLVALAGLTEGNSCHVDPAWLHGHMSALLSVCQSLRQPSADAAMHLASTMLSAASLQRRMNSSQLHTQGRPAAAATGAPSKHLPQQGDGAAAQPSSTTQPVLLNHDQLALLLGELRRHAPAAAPTVLSHMWLGLLRLGIYPDRETAGALLLSTHRRMHDMPPAALATLALSVSQLGIQPAAKWLDRFQAAAYERASSGAMLLRGRTSILWAAARAGWPLHRDFVAALVPSLRLLPLASETDTAMLAWALGRMRMRPGRAWAGGLLLAAAQHLDLDHDMDLARAWNKRGVSSNSQGGAPNTQHAPAGPTTPGQASAAEGAAQGPSLQVPIAAEPGGHSSGQVMGAREALMFGQGITALGMRPPGWWWRLWGGAVRRGAGQLDVTGVTLALRIVAVNQRGFLQQPALSQAEADSQDGLASASQQPKSHSQQQQQLGKQPEEQWQAGGDTDMSRDDYNQAGAAADEVQELLTALLSRALILLKEPQATWTPNAAGALIWALAKLGAGSSTRSGLLGHTADGTINQLVLQVVGAWWVRSLPLLSSMPTRTLVVTTLAVSQLQGAAGPPPVVAGTTSQPQVPPEATTLAAGAHTQRKNPAQQAHSQPTDSMEANALRIKHNAVRPTCHEGGNRQGVVPPAAWLSELRRALTRHAASFDVAQAGIVNRALSVLGTEL